MHWCSPVKYDPVNPAAFQITVKDLIDGHMLAAPVEAFGLHQGAKIEATIQRNGAFASELGEFSSPSVAAGRLITHITGSRSDQRNYFSVNGWKFWNVRCPDGQARNLATLREALLESRTTGSER